MVRIPGIELRLELITGVLGVVATVSVTGLTIVGSKGFPSSGRNLMKMSSVVRCFLVIAKTVAVSQPSTTLPVGNHLRYLRDLRLDVF